MSKFLKAGSELPPEQAAIRAKCFHPSGTFLPFEKTEIEQSIADRFERVAAQHADQIAVKSRSDALTYDSLNKTANRFACAIVSSGIEDPRPVALLLGHDAKMIAGTLGVLKTGKVCVPLDPGFHEARIAYLLKDSDAGLVVTDSKHLNLAYRSAPDPARIVNIDDINPGFLSRNLCLSIPHEGPCYLLYTSGSTGKPKGVLQNHRALLHDVSAYTNAFHICANDRLTLFASLSGGEGMKNAFAGLLNGATVCPWDIKKDGFAGLADWLINEEITVWISTPTLFRSFITTLGEEENFTALRVVRLGSGTVRKQDVELYKKNFCQECILINWLACTEIGSYSHYFIDKATAIQGEEVPVGFSLPDKAVLLLDDKGHKVGADKIGEIVVNSRYLPNGYWRRDDLTRAKFQPDPNGGDLWTYFTGDQGRMRSDGCLYHIGRKDLQIKVRGYRIEVGEIEAALETVEGVSAAAVVRNEISEFGDEYLVAYVVSKRKPAPTIRSLRDALGKKLPSYMQPSRFVFLDTLPLAPSGKIDRNALSRLQVSRPDIDAFVPPRTAMEEALAQIWAEVLELDRVGIHDNFFELGGHSLLATKVISRLRTAFAIEMPLRSLFESPTVAGLAEWLDALSLVADKYQASGSSDLGETDGLKL